ncbi:hypothetical protein HPB50_028570 [Hyalomma asiaticum]|nr:hypothetical protein HPB50_028570 [Hyalomma asiaticum]
MKPRGSWFGNWAPSPAQYAGRALQPWVLDSSGGPQVVGLSLSSLGIMVLVGLGLGRMGCLALHGAEGRGNRGPAAVDSRSADIPPLFRFRDKRLCPYRYRNSVVWGVVPWSPCSRAWPTGRGKSSHYLISFCAGRRIVARVQCTRLNSASGHQLRCSADLSSPCGVRRVTRQPRTLLEVDIHDDDEATPDTVGRSHVENHRRKFALLAAAGLG